MKKAVVIAGLLAASFGVTAADVFTWRTGTGTRAYSDVPQNLRTHNVSTVNVRTHTSTPLVTEQPPLTNVNAAASGASIADQQLKLNQQIAQQNKEIEERNKKMAEETKQKNCKTAQMNLNMAQSARTEQRAQLVQRYQGDVGKYCN